MSDKVSQASSSSFVTIPLSDNDETALVGKNPSSVSSQATTSKDGSSKSNSTGKASWIKAPFGFSGKKVEVADSSFAPLTTGNLKAHTIRTLAEKGENFFDVDEESDAGSAITVSDS